MRLALVELCPEWPKSAGLRFVTSVTVEGATLKCLVRVLTVC